MDGFLRPVALALASVTLLSATPDTRNGFSPELLALLDPSSGLAGLCGGEDAGSAMRSKLMVAAAIVAQPVDSSVPLYGGLGEVHLPITSANPRAQPYFDQGMGFTFGFNHSAAIASFREAQKIDPNCALCFWGEALAQGPNINAPMDPATNARSVGLARYANWLARNGTPVEKALTAAMLARYSNDPGADRAALDAAYADAMLAAAAAHPDNDTIALLAAESAMDTRPWDYWTADKQPNPRIGEAVKLVETVLARNPKHPQAAHLYIHLMENGPDPKIGEKAADILAAPLSPTAGHLVHMPAHIYYRLGRWKDSIRVNLDAAKADEAYLKSSGDKGLYRYGYYPHNVHFIVTSAQMAGDLPTAMRASKKLASLLDAKTSAEIAWIGAISAAPYFAAAQLSPPAEVLRMGPADARLPYVVAMRHYARASAFAQLRNKPGFDRELAALTALRKTGEWKPMIDQGVPAPELLDLAAKVAQGRWSYAAGRFGDAARHYRDAIAVEDAIPYMEPPYWYYPVQQSLGAALYRAGKYDEAREAFMAALARSPNNGWALYGLAASERALGQKAQAAAADEALQRAWMGDRNWLKMDRI